MLATIAATLRDGLEAAVLIGTLLSLIEKSGQREKGKLVVAGCLLGLLAVFGLLLLSSLSGRGLETLIDNFEIFEGVNLITSGLLIVLTVLILEKKATQIRASLSSRIQEALATQSTKLLFLIPFLIILTEGSEIALTSSRHLIAGNLGTVLMSIITGLLLVTAFIYLIFKTESGLNLKLPTLLVLIKAILLLTSLSLINHGLHELTEAGLLKAEEYRFSRQPGLNEVLKFLFGFKGKISVPQLGITILYGLWALRGLRALANRAKKGSPAA